jgi:hypothetical protein
MGSIRPAMEMNILSNDFLWLIERAKALVSRQIKEVWTNLVMWSFKNQDVVQIDALFVATQDDQNFQERFGAWFQSVEFGSDEAERMQAHYQSMQESKSQRESSQPKKISDKEIKERIDYCLNEFEDGKLNAWWWLNAEMTLDPNSPYYGSDLIIDLTSLNGWESADLGTRKRILNAAKQYIVKQNDSSNDWIGTKTYNLPSLAGCRALHLLLKEEPIFLNLVFRDVWTKWTPAILAFPHGNGAREELNLEFLKLAYFHAPTEFINTLLKLIDTENKNSSYIFIIDQLERCWDDQIKNALLGKVKALDLEPKCISQLLEELIKRNHEESRNFAESLLSWSSNEERQRAILVASVLIKHSRESDWDSIWNTVIEDITFAKEALEAASYSLRHIHLNLNEKQLADLHIWLEEHYPHTEDPVFDTAHQVEERESMGNFRDTLLSQLRETGTLKACQEIQRIIQHFPKYDLKWHLLKARNALRKKSWKPPESSELLQLITNSNKRLIQDGNQLLDVLIESLKRLELELQGETPAARDIWDKDSKNSFKPVNENTFSNYVKRHFDRDLKLQAIFANREVELRANADGANQERTDIHIDAVIRNHKGEIIDSITVIIEVKGCWHDELDIAMETQLVNRYLKDNACQYGLYLIGWFNCDRWSSSDNRKAKAPRTSIEQTRESFESQAESLSQDGVNVRSFVLNASLR